MIKIFYVAGFFIFNVNLFSQGWVQTSSTPTGGGVTDLVVRSNGDIIATVGSFNWPSVEGGIRKSTDDGASWQNAANAYTGRTIEEAFDGNLYASIWFYPQNEGLYRSTDAGTSWQGPIYSVASGDNIFSIAVKPSLPEYSIFVGTRNGVARSTNSGITFLPANTGIPANSWVRDLEIDSSGIIAAATTNGVFISTNNGDSWTQSTGFAAQDTVVSLAFVYSQTGNDGFNPFLLAGTDDGNLYQAFISDLYFFFSLAYALSGRELSSISVVYTVAFVTAAIIYLSYYPRYGLLGGIYRSTADRMAFVQMNQGLPANPQTSIVGGQVVLTRSGEEERMYTGLYENTSNGAKIYKLNLPVGVDNKDPEIPQAFILEQNFPNPFNPITTILFSLPEQTFVRLEIFNSLGEKVSTLVSEELNAGNYEYDWNADNLAEGISAKGGYTSGVYFYKLTTADFTQTKKLILLK